MAMANPASKLSTSVILNASDTLLVAKTDKLPDGSFLSSIMSCRYNATACDSRGLISFPAGVDTQSIEAKLLMTKDLRPVLVAANTSDLLLQVCKSPSCLAPNQTQPDPILLASAPTYAITSVAAALDPNNNDLMVAYAKKDDYDRSNNRLVLVRCNGLECTDGDPAVHAIDTDADFIKLALTSAGNPVILYASRNLYGTFLIVCSDPMCTKTVRRTILDWYLDDPYHIALTLTPDDIPMFSHDFGGNLNVGQCADQQCSTWTSIKPLNGSAGAAMIYTDSAACVTTVYNGKVALLRCA